MKPHKLISLPFFLISLVLNTLVVKAQDHVDPAKQYIPNITVAPPQVAAMSKVGEIPIDISTGRINYMIPIFEIQEGNFTMPINLSYNYSGLLLNETPGYAGVGWNFNIGGSILHVINGLDDDNRESDKEALHKYINKLPPYHNEFSPEGKTRISNFLEFIADGIIDGEPDKYVINVGNINCSFYLDKDNNPIFLKNQNYKITRQAYNGFIFTDDQGINYIFDSVLTATKFSSENTDYNSSFLLTEINFPNTTNKILFQYDPNPGSFTDINVSQTLVKTTNELGNPDNHFILRTNTTGTHLNTRNLRKIVTNNYTIELHYNQNPEEPAISVIDTLTIKDNFKNSVKKYDFTFSPWAGRRTNLLNVKYNGQIVNEMEYDMSVPYPLPSQIDSYHLKKDLWGYYNANVVPVSPLQIRSPYNNPSIKPDFSSVKIGSLKKIAYQTKGYSLIEYEQNTIQGGYDFPYHPDELPRYTYVDAETSAFDGITVEKTFDITTPTQLKISYTIDNQSIISPYSENKEAEVFLIKDDLDDSNATFNFRKIWQAGESDQWMPGETKFNGTIEIFINQVGRYRLKAISSIGVVASIGVRMLKNDSIQPPSLRNQTVGGLRIKQIKNCDFNDQCVTTVYNYSQAGNSTGVMLQKPEFYSGSNIQDNKQCRGQYIKQEYFNYTSIYPLSNYRGSPVLYKTVEKRDYAQDKNGQLVSNGSTIFSYHGGEVGNSLMDESYFTIGLLDTKLVKDENNAKVTNQKNNYLTRAKPDVPKYVYALQCRIVSAYRWLLAGECVMSYPRPISDFKFEIFRHEAKNYKLQKEENKNYFNGDSIVQTIEYNYNLNTGFLKSQKSSTSKVDEVKETKYSYPQDPEIVNEPFVNDLIIKNIIGTPIKTETFRNTVKLSEQKTEYTKTSDNLLLPKFVYAKKGEGDIDKSVDKKISYDQYDNKGNLLQYTPDGGVPVSIIWGYNKTQPIAKIDNVTYDQIANYVSNLQSLSDVDNDNCLSSGCKEQTLRNALNSFRNSFPQNMISTYTYNPLVGVTSITDAKGIPTYYEYGASNRLQFIKDKDLNILQKYCYNYKGEQIDCDINIVYRSNARTGSFVKNNCASGGTGSSVAYSQAEGVETSIISQADADALGLSRFNIDGQANANTNGTCTYYSTARSSSFSKNNCAVGQIGSAVAYSQAEGVVASTVSQADADALGISKFNTDGQANANINGTCMTPLPAPTGLAFNSSTETSLNFSWIAVSGATSYKIYKNGSDTGITSSTNTGSLSGLTASTAYSIQVLAVNAWSNSALSAEVSMTTAATPISNSCSLNFSRVSGSCVLYKNGPRYLSRSTSGTSSGTLTTGDTFYVTVTASTAYYKGITITSSIRGELYNFQFSKTGTILVSPTFTKEGSEEITIDCRTD